jgi:hypothetical protein
LLNWQVIFYKSKYEHFMKAVKIFIAAALLISLTGCIQISTLISVNKDGSGTVEETVLLSREIIEMISELEKAFAEDTTDLKPFEFYNEEELRTQKNQFGEEVQYISSRKISQDNREGYLVMYEFQDLNKLRINQNPNSRVKLESFEDEPEVQEEFITFSYIAGKPKEIRIQMPAEEMIGEAKEEEWDTSTEETEADTSMMNEQLARVFKDLRVSLVVEVAGTINRTNADYVEGSRITLLDIEFGKMIENPEVLGQFRDTDPQNFEQVKTLLKGMPGIKVDLNKLITVQFD